MQFKALYNGSVHKPGEAVMVKLAISQFEALPEDLKRLLNSPEGQLLKVSVEPIQSGLPLFGEQSEPEDAGCYECGTPIDMKAEEHVELNGKRFCSVDCQLAYQAGVEARKQEQETGAEPDAFFRRRTNADRSYPWHKRDFETGKTMCGKNIPDSWEGTIALHDDAKFCADRATVITKAEEA